METAAPGGELEANASELPPAPLSVAGAQVERRLALEESNSDQEATRTERQQAGGKFTKATNWQVSSIVGNKFPALNGLLNDFFGTLVLLAAELLAFCRWQFPRVTMSLSKACAEPLIVCVCGSFYHGFVCVCEPQFALSRALFGWNSNPICQLRCSV